MGMSYKRNQNNKIGLKINYFNLKANYMEDKRREVHLYRLITFPAILPFPQ